VANFDPVLDVTDLREFEAFRYFGGETRTQRLKEHLNQITSEMSYETNKKKAYHS